MNDDTLANALYQTPLKKHSEQDDLAGALEMLAICVANPNSINTPQLAIELVITHIGYGSEQQKTDAKEYAQHFIDNLVDDETIISAQRLIQRLDDPVGFLMEEASRSLALRQQALPIHQDNSVLPPFSIHITAAYGRAINPFDLQTQAYRSPRNGDVYFSSILPRHIATTDDSAATLRAPIDGASGILNEALRDLQSSALF